jgi:hypothetical protein
VDARVEGAFPYAWGEMRKFPVHRPIPIVETGSESDFSRSGREENCGTDQDFAILSQVLGGC